MATHAQALPTAQRSALASLIDWVTTVDHKKIGVLYIGLNFFFFILAGVMALVLRTQLAWSNLKIVDPDRYNELFTMHGTTMIFLVIVPIWAGFANYFLPIMIGARDMAFPRLNALSFWLLFFSGLVMYSSYFFGQVPNAGWTSYPPLTADRTFAPGANIDFWILGLHLGGLSSLFGAINFIVTTMRLRAPGMKLMEVPMFVWSMLITSFMVLFGTPMLSVAISLLLADRHFGTNFFIPAGGGDPLLWQNLFWFYSHPAVYIMILPAMGAVSEILPVFSRKPLFGYTFIAWSSVGIAVLGFSVWAHHMFQVGSSLAVNTFFSLATIVIAIPTGIKIFNWIATMWGGALRLEPPMYFAIGMVTMFIIGGLSGVMLGSVPVNWQMHQTYFVVAHLHYVLFGGSVFGIFAAMYYWLPKMTGFKLNRSLGVAHFWLMMLGFNLTFFPQHIAGILGMPRRIYTYAAGQGWETYNLLSTIGAFLIALSVLVFIINFLASARRAEPAGDNPWDGATLEWATSSPPPEYNFAQIPTVSGPNPLWAAKGGPAGQGTGQH
ncbi:MAG: cytochrome c oxidase subunit I [Anaerolineales bacterium]|nr:cytochrome c oxidase subunit I [Anaerolineales bacterium]